MDTEYLLNVCRTAEKVIAAKGYFRCEVDFHINWVGRTYSMSVEYRTNPDDYHSAIRESFKDEDIQSILDQVQSYIDGIRPFSDIKREQFLTRLARLVEDAESLGIEIPALRPALEEYRNNLLPAPAQ